MQVFFLLRWRYYSLVIVVQYLNASIMIKILVHRLDQKKDGSSDFIVVVLNKNLTVNFVILNHLNRLKLPPQAESSVAQADELLTDFPQFSRFLSIAGFLRQSVLKGSRVLVPAPVNSRFCQARITHNLS